MAIVDDLNRIADWMQANVCDLVKLKMPADDVNTDGYAYELVTPTAFALFQPGKDMLPPAVKAPIPSLCVRLEGGEHRPAEGVHELRLIVHFAVWNPGTHGKDVFQPVGGSGWHGYNNAASTEFKRNTDGWQDLYSFIDVALRAIESAGYIDGLRVKAEDGIKYGMEDYQLDDFYPYWPAWIRFTVQAGNIRNQSINDLL
jgi:hypothetical protein